jgi:hypothetical protein
MTTENSPLESSLEKAKAGTTVFADGSTFDYEHGYRSNGAVPDRHRKEPVRIVKTGEVVSFKTALNILYALIAILIIAIVAAGVVKMVHNAENERTIEGIMKTTGAAEVVKKSSVGPHETLVIRNKQDKGLYSCDVEYVNEGVSTALIFCSPGGPSNFSIPLPYDPENIFYTGPSQDS